MSGSPDCWPASIRRSLPRPPPIPVTSTVPRPAVAGLPDRHRVAAGLPDRHRVAAGLAEVTHFVYLQGLGKNLLQRQEPIDDTELTASTVPPLLARGMTGVPLPSAGAGLHAVPYPLGRPTAPAPQVLGHLLLAALGLQRRELSHRYPDHRAIASGRAKYPVHALVLDERKLRYLDVYRHALVDVPVESLNIPAALVPEPGTVAMILAARYQDLPAGYQQARASITEAELGIAMRSLAVTAQLHGITMHARVGGEVAEQATELLAATGPGTWSAPVVLTLDGVALPASQPLPGRQVPAHAFLAADHHLELPDPSAAEARRISHTRLAYPHAGENRSDGNRSGDPADGADGVPGIPPAGAAGPLACCPPRTWTEVFADRSAGRVGGGRNGFALRPHQLPAACLADLLAWTTMTPTTAELAAVGRRITLRVAMQRVDGHASGLYRWQHGALHPEFTDPSLVRVARAAWRPEQFAGDRDRAPARQPGVAAQRRHRCAAGRVRAGSLVTEPAVLRLGHARARHRGRRARPDQPAYPLVRRTHDAANAAPVQEGSADVHDDLRPIRVRRADAGSTPVSTGQLAVASRSDELNTSRTWHSWHLHTGSFEPRALESIVTGVVAPTITALAGQEPGSAPPRPWFFMRYWQQGPHVRLRIADLDEAQASRVAEDLGRAWNTHSARAADEERLEAADYLKTVSGIAAAGEGAGALDVASLRSPGVYPAVYEPETERYGGSELLRLSEDLFRVSSVASLRAITLRGGQRPAFADGVESMAAMVSAWPGDPIELLSTVRASWTAFLRQAFPHLVDTVEPVATSRAQAFQNATEAIRGLVEGRPSRWTSWSDRLRHATRLWIDQLGEQRARGIFTSHLHMTRTGSGSAPDKKLIYRPRC